jgi:PAS domain-containing protein
MRTRRNRGAKALHTPQIDPDLIDAITDPVIVKDNQRRILLANEAPCAFIGRTELFHRVHEEDSMRG